MSVQKWIALLITLATFSGGFIYDARAKEHRITIIEEAIKSQQRSIEQHQQLLDIQIEQLRIAQATLSRLVVLEDFLHGMTPDEELGYYRKKSKANQVPKSR